MHICSDILVEQESEVIQNLIRIIRSLISNTSCSFNGYSRHIYRNRRIPVMFSKGKVLESFAVGAGLLL